MDIKAIQQRIDEQILEGVDAYHLPATRLGYAANIFKPDSPRLETVVSVDIGRRDLQTRSTVAVRYFYSPKKYNSPGIENLKKAVETYLEACSVKPLT